MFEKCYVFISDIDGYSGYGLNFENVPIEDMEKLAVILMTSPYIQSVVIYNSAFPLTDKRHKKYTK